MANLSVASIRERIFNTSKHENNVARPQNTASHNPFAQMNGNLLNADVYVSSKTNSGEKISFSSKIGFGKLTMATRVGTLSGIGQKFRQMIEPAVAFGKRAIEGAKTFGRWLNETTPSDIIASVYSRTPNAKYYAKADIAGTEATLRELVAIESARMIA